MSRARMQALMLQEASSLMEAARRLPPEVDEALAILRSAERLVVTGVGKSGQVGRKIASSLASLGVPALFVHSDEALHGDLGMIQPGDAVIAISNSGETAEVLAMLPGLRALGAKVVALVGKADSSLARAADAVIAYGAHPEVDALGLAPTTSALITLAVGDAIAAILSEERGFTAEDFHLRHPGGSLGAYLASRTVRKEG